MAEPSTNFNFQTILRDVDRLDIPYNVTAGTVIQPGDLVWFNGTTLKNVGGSSGLVTTWSSETQARRLARARFAGVAHFTGLSSDLIDKTVIVSSGCIHVLRTDAQASGWYVGDMVGFKKDAGGNYLYSNQVTKVYDPRDAIGFVVKKNTATAATQVEAYVCSAYQRENVLDSMVGVLSWYFGATTWPGATTTIVNDYTFGMRVRLLELKACVETLTAGADITTVKNGANSLGTTLTVPDASAVGTVVTATLAGDANGYDVFDYADLMDITHDTGATAGAVNYHLYFSKGIPLLA